jgi:hypothetical protein
MCTCLLCVERRGRLPVSEGGKDKYELAAALRIEPIFTSFARLYFGRRQSGVLVPMKDLKYAMNVADRG